MFLICIPVTINFFMLPNRSLGDHFIPTFDCACQQKNRLTNSGLPFSERLLAPCRWPDTSSSLQWYSRSSEELEHRLLRWQKSKMGLNGSPKLLRRSRWGLRQTWQLSSMVMVSILVGLPADVPGCSSQKRINTLSTLRRPMGADWSLSAAAERLLLERFGRRCTDGARFDWFRRQAILLPSYRSRRRGEWPASGLGQAGPVNPQTK